MIYAKYSHFSITHCLVLNIEGVDEISVSEKYSRKSNPPGDFYLLQRHAFDNSQRHGIGTIVAAEKGAINNNMS